MPAARGMTMTTTSWTMLMTLLDTGPGSRVLRVSFSPALGVQYQSPRQHLPLRHHLQLQKFLLVSHSVEFITWAINHSPSTFKSYYGIIRVLIVVEFFSYIFTFQCLSPRWSPALFLKSRIQRRLKRSRLSPPLMVHSIVTFLQTPRPSVQNLQVTIITDF